MKCVILAGGKGSRLSEYTKKIPKPMIEIGKKPIILHIIEYYLSYGIKDFIIASGYKHRVIKNYFSKKKTSYNVRVVNTGKESLTGKRIKLLEKFFKKNENFLMTYGDGLSDVNLSKLIKFHLKNKKIFTLTAVHPPARFGELTINKNSVKNFEEKPQLNRGWINGGFFVINSLFFKILSKKNVMLEREPIKNLLKLKQLGAFRHEKFWYCMDNLRDKKILENLIKNKKAPWLKKK